MYRVLRKTKNLKKFLPISDRQWAKFDLLRTLVRRDLESRYKGLALGCTPCRAGAAGPARRMCLLITVRTDRRMT